MKHTGGRPVVDQERQAWAMRFNLTPKQQKALGPAMCWQLCRCHDDEGRRILLGITERM